MKKLLAWLGIFVVVLLVAALVLRLFVFDVMQAQGEDMWPGVGRGAWLLVNRISAPKRGDLIVFRRAEGGAYVVRRVIALPGEKVAVTAGKPLAGRIEAHQEDQRTMQVLGHAMTVVRESMGGRSWSIVADRARPRRDHPEETVNGFFVLADNRDHGADSRDFGVVPPERVRGIVQMAFSEGDGP